MSLDHVEAASIHRSFGISHLMRARDVADVLGLPVTTVYAHARDGRLPAIRIGRRVRFEPDAIRDFIESGGEPLEGGWRHEEEAT